MNEQLEQRLREEAAKGNLSCAVARKIAAEFGIPPKEVGEAANTLNIKIAGCELGCF